MRRSDLQHRCIVDLSVVFDFIRTITIDGKKVQVAYDNKASFDLQEGGFYFAARFGSVDQAVTYLEQYLGRPFGQWQLFPRELWPADFDPAVPDDSFWTALRENRIDLPDPDHFVLLSSEFFRDRLPFPSRYRDRK